MKRIFSAVLVLILLVSCTAAWAADTWTCPNCGQTGNTGKFCPNCGATKPVENVEGVWTCPKCNNSGNTGNFCSNCGQPKPSDTATEIQTGTSNVKIGDFITFGKYEQDNKLNNGSEPIEWQVLEVKDGKALVVCRYALMVARFNRNSNWQTWYNCSLRDMLNGSFYREAFTAAEKNAIQESAVEDNEEQWNSSNPPHQNRMTGDTMDNIFILSYGEMVHYLPNASERRCKPTRVCQEQSVLTQSGYCVYWMRNPAYKNNADCIMPDGTTGTNYIHRDRIAVRPACWVELAGIGY